MRRTFWDERVDEKLSNEGVIAAMLEEIRQVHLHKVYVKVPIAKCWNRTGKAGIQAKLVDLT